ncbi:Serine/threonine protein kinase [Quillaja saponaria]|uniref:Serine/threonine protein kinase n=1 Tax=Quillaja saponaria TaxID=32244 RepID=A0AAD7LIM4_QUISA|nr:Serine/threonine protein kinase [Quillaja saponaria]
MHTITPTNDNKDDSGSIAAGIVVSLLVLAGIGAISCFCAKRAKEAIVNELRVVVAQPATNVVRNLEVDAPTMERFFLEMAMEKPVRFTAQQLCSFTNNYAKTLGSGGFGVVYKGQFPNGVEIAVKVLKRSLDKSAEEQFMSEVGTIGRPYHINLVRLYGFCYDQFMSALVYEYMENGSLDKYLFSENQEIGWETLHNIAIGTARGIAYLHEECHQRIIHYDIKPGNVLVDANFFPKVADFGLAKLCNRDDTHISMSGFRGTPGYSAPEFLLKNHPITHNLDWFPKHVWDKYEKHELYAMTVGCGIEEKDREKAERMSMVALWCVQDSPDARPPMSAVVKMLEGGVEIMAPPKPFHYLYSVVNSTFKPPATSDGSGNSTSEGTDSYWYKETTSIMAKYEIQMASA